MSKDNNQFKNKDSLQNLSKEEASQVVIDMLKEKGIYPAEVAGSQSRLPEDVVIVPNNDRTGYDLATKLPDGCVPVILSENAETPDFAIALSKVNQYSDICSRLEKDKVNHVTLIGEVKSPRYK